MNAAFFDIDGTLVGKPSLERRLFRDLCWQRKIPAENYLLWLAATVRVGVRDLPMAIHGNKTYLRGLRAHELSANRGPQRCRGKMELFPAAVQRVWWHAMRGDRIVLVSGTLELLAERVKFALEREMLWRGIEVKAALLATRLEISDGRFTGRVLGAPMFAQEKARAIQEFAIQNDIRLSQCSAYGDSALDRWMLVAVGHPVAVNPDTELRSVARLRGWPTVSWNLGGISAAFDSRRAAAGITGVHWKRRSETAR